MKPKSENFYQPDLGYEYNLMQEDLALKDKICSRVEIAYFVFCWIVMVLHSAFFWTVLTFGIGNLLRIFEDSDKVTAFIGFLMVVIIVPVLVSYGYLALRRLESDDIMVGFGSMLALVFTIVAVFLILIIPQGMFLSCIVNNDSCIITGIKMRLNEAILVNVLCSIFPVAFMMIPSLVLYRGDSRGDGTPKEVNMALHLSVFVVSAVMVGLIFCVGLIPFGEDK